MRICGCVGVRVENIWHIVHLTKCAEHLIKCAHLTNFALHFIEVRCRVGFGLGIGLRFGLGLVLGLESWLVL